MDDIKRIELGISISVEKDTPTQWILRVYAKDKATKDYIASVIKEENMYDGRTPERKEELLQDYKELFDEETLCVYQGVGIYYCPNALTLLRNNFLEYGVCRKYFFKKIGDELYKAMIMVTGESSWTLQGKEVAFYLETKEETDKTFYFSKFFLHEVLGGLRKTVLGMLEYAREKNEYDRNDGDTMPGMPFSMDEYTHISRTKFDFDWREYRVDGTFITIKDRKDRG